jgi:hypothetical protein
MEFIMGFARSRRQECTWSPEFSALTASAECRGASSVREAVISLTRSLLVASERCQIFQKKASTQRDGAATAAAEPSTGTVAATSMAGTIRRSSILCVCVWLPAIEERPTTSHI